MSRFNIKNRLLWFARMVLSGAISIALLSAFAFCYSYSGVHHPNPSGATDYLWNPNQFVVQREEGNAILRYDANGFNNSQWNPDRPIDILMMGDSNMQAERVPVQESPAYLLNQLYPEKYTYSIALGAHKIYTCVKNIGNALQEYTPTDYVLINTNQLDLDTVSMQNVLDNSFATIPSYDQSVLAIIQEYIPGIKVLYKRFTDWITANTMSESDAVYTNSLSMTEYTEILDEFLGKAAQTASDYGVKLIILYVPKTEIQVGGGITYLTDPDYLAVFMHVCDRNGIIFADMTGAYERLYREQYRAPYGFTNTEVGEGHINKYGYQVIAEDLVKILREMEEVA